MLRAILESVEELSEVLRKEYTEQTSGPLTGKFLLDVEAVGGVELRDTEALKGALGRERENARLAAEKLKQFDDLDPIQAREALKKVDEMRDWNPEQKLQEGIKAREAQLLTKHSESLSTKQVEVDGLTSQLEKVLIINAATLAISAQKGNPKLLLPHVLAQTRMRKSDNGQFIVDVIGDDGIARVGDASGGAMSIPQLIEEMKGQDDFSVAFAGSGASGSGAGSGSGSGSGSEGRKVGVPKTINASDQAAIDANIEGIADGTIIVVQDGEA